MGWSEEAAVSTPLKKIHSKMDVPETDVEDPLKGRTCLRCGKNKCRKMFYENPNGFNGLGATCKKCLKELTSSDEHRDKKRDWYDDRKRSGQCVGCSSSDMVTSVHCRKCWFKNAAAARCGGRQNVDQVLSLWEEQNGRCYYTGVELVPGDNASLDHQIPRSRGGKDVIDNLKWVSDASNMMKFNMTHEEFIDACRNVADRFSK